ncbi:MAG: ParA family protein [Aphanocapsa sp. GSE-SYN-MK-11-07L]|jgi:chromosome partitioning protein|nr:ParA family protein [Aphanocapsa sp. GSE-SYN-MK-11-07L]
MKTLAIVSRKGGVGKSTLTMNLAAVSDHSAILDTDPQASCADWSDRRGYLQPPVITVPAGRVRVALRQQNSSYCFIDTQPSAEASLIEIAQVSDLCIIVLRPGQLELDALGATLAAIRAANAKAVFCINQAHPQANLNELIDGLEQHYSVGPVLRSRADYPAAVAEGKAVIEWNPSGKAASEIFAYWDWLKEKAIND